MTHRTAVYGYRHLNETTIRLIAGRYDLDPNSELVRANAAQADDYHGTVSAQFDGDMQRFWGCGETGRYDAAKLLDGYLDEETRVSRCETAAARDFESAAYGC